MASLHDKQARRRVHAKADESESTSRRCIPTDQARTPAAKLGQALVGSSGLSPGGCAARLRPGHFLPLVEVDGLRRGVRRAARLAARVGKGRNDRAGSASGWRQAHAKRRLPSVLIATLSLSVRRASQEL